MRHPKRTSSLWLPAHWLGALLVVVLSGCLNPRPEEWPSAEGAEESIDNRRPIGPAAIDAADEQASPDSEPVPLSGAATPAPASPQYAVPEDADPGSEFDANDAGAEGAPDAGADGG